MINRTVAEDLSEFSCTASLDEERLLVLYRRSSREDRSRLLFRLTRLQFSPWFAVDFDRAKDETDRSYLHEELEAQLRAICPREHLGELVFDLAPVQLEGLWISAWGSIAPVILGASDQDGERADELHRAVAAVYSDQLRHRVKFERRDALLLIEGWRETALQLIFSEPK